MKRLSVLSLVVLSMMMLLFTGCSAIFHTTEAGEIIEKAYDFSDFTSVEISDAIKYEVIQSDHYSVLVSAHESVFERMDIHREGKTLYIGRKFSFFNGEVVKVTVTMPQLNKLVVSGASKGSANGFDSTEDMAIKVSGASNLDINISAGKTGLDISEAGEITGNLTAADTQIKLSSASELNMAMKTGTTTMYISGASQATGTLHALDFTLTLSGASNCDLTGLAGNTSIKASGAGDINSPGLILQSVDIELSGASYANVYTDGTMNINLSGASTLDYSGSPTIAKIDISGGSKINHK